MALHLDVVLDSRILVLDVATAGRWPSAERHIKVQPADGNNNTADINISHYHSGSGGCYLHVSHFKGG